MGMAVSVPRYTVEDLDQFEDDGNRYELLDGVLLVTSGPSSAHQTVSMNLSLILGTALQAMGVARVYAPGSVSFPPFTHLLPDVLVVPALYAPDAPWVHMTERWLAVEIMSRSSRRYDRDFKRDAYLALGVHEVWIVDTRDKSVEVCRERGDGELVRDVIAWRVPESGVTIPVELSKIFAGIS